MIKESKYCSEVMTKNYNKELVMTKEDNEDFKNSTKCWICDNDYVNNDVKVRDHCQINGKYRGSTHRHRNINLKLNLKLPIVFHNQKIYDSHHFNHKIDVIPNGLENIWALPSITSLKKNYLAKNCFIVLKPTKRLLTKT